MPHQQRRQQNAPTPSAKQKPDLGILRFKAEGSQVTIQLNSEASAFDGDGVPSRATLHTLRVDLKTSKVWVGQAAPLPESSSYALGIIGLLCLERGAILALATEATRVCGLVDGPVYKVKNTTLVAPEAINGSQNDLRYAALLQEALDPKNFGSHMYFSHTATITVSRQRQADSQPDVPDLDLPNAADGASPRDRVGPWWQAAPAPASVDGPVDDSSASDSAEAAAAGSGGQSGQDKAKRSGGSGGAGGGGTLWSRADPRFVWNRELMRPLIDAGGEAFALPMMVGYIGIVSGLTFRLRRSAVSQAAGGEEAPGDGGAVVSGAEAMSPGELTLITRLGAERPVAGGWRRGADMQGYTAGFAESEMLLSMWQPDELSGQAEPGPDGSLRVQARVAVASYVVLRGSAPLLWAAPPDLQPCPAPRGPEDVSRHKEPFAKHVEALMKAYGKPLLLLNLICGANRGAQLRLHDALQQQADECGNAVRAKPAAKATPVSVEAAKADAAGVSSDPVVTDEAAPREAAPARGVVVVGMPLERSDLGQLASCGKAAARLEAACSPEFRRIRPFVAVEQLEMVVAPPTASPPPPPPTQQPGSGGKGPGGAAPLSRRVVCVGRRLGCRQEGVVRVSSASTGSAGGSCEEVDLAQHCLALPVVAEALVALGAMGDTAELEEAHADVMFGLAQLWSHQADVLSDQILGTASAAGRALRAAAAGHEHRGGGLGWIMERLVRRPWRSTVGAGDAISRYYYGNFTDARRQDAVDLASGAFKMSQPPAELPGRRPPSTTSIQLGILFLVMSLIQAVICVFRPPPGLHELAMRVLGPAAVGGLLLYNLMRTGAEYVEKPLLRPLQVFPWTQ